MRTVYSKFMRLARYGWSGWLTALTAFIFAVWYAALPYQGDDLSYQATFASAEGLGHGIWPLYKLPSFVAHHWLYVNGRFANDLAALFLGLFPQRLCALMAGGMTGLMLMMVLQHAGIWCRKGWQTLATVVIGIYMFIFPWWDTMLYIDCNFNYVWSTALPLVFLWLLWNPQLLTGAGKTAFFGVVVFAFLAGGMHEAATAPLCAGLLWWVWQAHAWRGLPRRSRVLMVMFFAGAAVVALSPGILMRASSLGRPDDVLPVLLLKSVPFTLVLIVWLLVELLRSRLSRRRLWLRMRTRWGVWIVASLASMCLVALGGIVGRSGWFSQTYAIIAMVLLLRRTRWRVGERSGAVVSAVIALLIIVHGATLSVRLFKAGNADRAMRAAIAGSNDNCVFFDLPKGDDEPWWTLGRVRVMKPYDTYTRHFIGFWYGKDFQPVILPRAAAAIDFAGFKGVPLSEWLGAGFENVAGEPLPGGAFLATGLPAGSYKEPYTWFVVDENHFIAAGREFSAVEFQRAGRTFYLYYPRFFELGERSPL